MINKSGEISCEEVWLRAWLAVATASNSTTPNAATTWADVCLREFGARFIEAKKSQNEPPPRTQATLGGKI